MKLITRILAFFILLPLCSCFEIMEEVNMNPNGSGLLTVTFNLSQSKMQLDKILAQDTIMGYDVPNRKDIDASFNNLVTKLKAVPGITNPIMTKDYTNYIFNLKCNFAHVKALNSAVNTIWRNYDPKADTSKVHYTYAGNKFQRLFDSNIIRPYKAKIGIKEKEILGSASYTSVYRFQNEISTSSNASATISKSRKAILMKANLLDILYERKSLVNTITLVK